MQTIRLITFDVTNTLIKFKSSVGYEYCKIADLYGIKCNNENTVKAINSNFSIVMRQMKKESPFYGITEGINCNQWWYRLVVRTFSSSGVEMSPETEAKLKLTATHLYKLFSTAEPYQLIDGVEDTLSALQKNGKSIQIGVISNSDERLPTILSQLGIGHFFRFIILPQFIRAAKPDPIVFQAALDKSNLKEPSQALHIGDDLVKDYYAAKSCNWNALLFGKGSSISDTINSKNTIKTIKELTYDSILEKLN